MAAKAISSPVPVEWYPTLAVVMVSVGLMFTASFFIYEATSSKRSRSLAKEITTAAVASVLLGFGSLFVLLQVVFMFDDCVWGRVLGFSRLRACTSLRLHFSMRQLRDYMT
uniref:Dolichyl-diphosphooligosaccharide-protein glycosyltransferase subunit OST5 n=1 Tax=Zea mays TaxID=4577 RepID=B6TSS6_MAIZE|nr:hypothetical protein [Zea mays]